VADLDTPEQIAELVRRFYADVAQDDLLGPLFEDVAGVDWSEHLPKLTAFWCRALLGQVGYAGNPYRAHALVHARQPFTLAHFERWLALFADTIDAWSGPNTERALELVADVARVHSRQLTGDTVSVRLALGTAARGIRRPAIDLRAPDPVPDPSPDRGGPLQPTDDLDDLDGLGQLDVR
jgi:hemoglobin